VRSVESQERKIIEIKKAGSFDKNEDLNPGANILKKNDDTRVHLFHEGMNIYSDYALFFKQKNSFKATGNVVVKQGDSITLISKILDYNGNDRKIIAKGNVDFSNKETNLKTEILYHDRNKKEFFFEDWGVIKDSLTTISSEEGKYFQNESKYKFQKNVLIENPDYTIDSDELDYYTKTEHAFFYGPTKIVGKDYKIYCEKGFYDTVDKKGFFNKNSRIHYDKRIIEGDSLTFDDKKKFALGIDNIIITDTINNTIIKGNYAEVFKSLDSAMITKKSYAIKVIDKDSLFIKADSLFAIGPPNERKIKGRFNVKIFKNNMSGRSDKILIDEKSGITKLLRNKLSSRQTQIMTEKEITKINPIIWIANNQMTGDEIHITRDLKTNNLDSLKILNNAFVIEKDTLGQNNFNQIKGITLLGKFLNNNLNKVQLIQNTQMVYYLYDDQTKKLIGIDKAICSSIVMDIKNNAIREITFYTDPEGEVSPEKDLDENLKILNGFDWRINEKINDKSKIFDN